MILNGNLSNSTGKPKDGPSSSSQSSLMVSDYNSIRLIQPPTIPGGTFPDLARSVDYDRHPAYRRLVQDADLGRRTRAIGSFVRTFAGLLVKRIMRYEMIPFDIRAAGGLSLIKQGLRNALRLDPPACTASSASPVLSSLREHGIAVVQIDAAQFQQLQAEANAHFEFLAERRRGRGNAKREFEESRSTASRKSEPHLYAVIDTLMRKADRKSVV